MNQHISGLSVFMTDYKNKVKRNCKSVYMLILYFIFMVFCPYPVDQNSATYHRQYSHLKCAEKSDWGFWKIIDVLSLHFTGPNQSPSKYQTSSIYHSEVAKMICSASLSASCRNIASQRADFLFFLRF